MHYTGTIWRPPYEANSLLLEVTAGCTHHKCKFCTLYDDLPFSFKMSSMETIQQDLEEVKQQLQLWHNSSIKRTFLTGANPFVLKASKLIEIAEMIKQHITTNETIGCFSRITDIALKTDEELLKLHSVGYDGITIGIETGYDEALTFMNKGYTSKDIVKQCKRLEKANIRYHFFYLAGIAGEGKGQQNAKATAQICNQLSPNMIVANMLTIYNNSELYTEIQNGNWKEQTELEKYNELKTLVENINIDVCFAALGASNAIPIQSVLPREKQKVITLLEQIIKNVSEKELKEYRVNLKHL